MLDNHGEHTVPCISSPDTGRPVFGEAFGSRWVVGAPSDVCVPNRRTTGLYEASVIGISLSNLLAVARALDIALMRRSGATKSVQVCQWVSGKRGRVDHGLFGVYPVTHTVVEVERDD